MLGENSIAPNVMIVITVVVTILVLAVVITGFRFFQKLSREDRAKRDRFRK